MNNALGSWIALDIGGANIKAAHESGQARTLPFELWKRPDELAEVLAKLSGTFPPSGRVAVTMTAELCDCYPTKAVGVNAILDAALDAFSGNPLKIWGTDGRFHDVEDAREQPLIAAASNWLALGHVAARLVPEGPGILIDIGTTTTDLIPLRDGRASARGRTDTERLQAGELVYAGMRRTPICALATELPHRGQPTGLAAEIFASTLDVYLTLDEVPPDPKDSSTADGRPATKDAARDRLARMVGADRDGFSIEDTLAFAKAADECLLARLASAAERACLATVGRPRAAVVAGSGEFLARRLARRVIERRVRPRPPRPGRRGIRGRRARRRRVTHPLVVKVGGSLLDWPELPGRLADYLATREAEKRLLVVGGGRTIDVIRDLDRVHGLGDDRAHHLALHSLDLTAHLLASLRPESPVVERLDDLATAWENGHVPILAPRHFLLSEDARSDDPLPASWDVTSDSIAARVAVHLGAAELALLKSAPLPPGTDRRGAARCGLVDPVFPDIARDLERVSYVNLRDLQRIVIIL